jgi:1,4-dihydroxy-2-naphthoyl-CoA hydrolase
MLKTQVLSRSDDEIRARVEVTDALKQPLGLVHGGVFATLADQLTTDATMRAISSQTSFLRPVTGGHVNAAARRRHNGRTTAVWELDITDDEGRLCALVRITLALRQGIPRGRYEPGAAASAAGTRS